MVGNEVRSDLADRAFLRPQGALTVSRIGLPLSHVSATARASRFASMRSAIFSRMFERSVTVVLPHASAALCAASSASSTSAALPRATSQNTCPVTGVTFSKYWPDVGGTYSPPM